MFYSLAQLRKMSVAGVACIHPVAFGLVLSPCVCGCTRPSLSLPFIHGVNFCMRVLCLVQVAQMKQLLEQRSRQPSDPADYQIEYVRVPARGRASSTVSSMQRQYIEEIDGVPLVSTRTISSDSSGTEQQDFEGMQVRKRLSSATASGSRSTPSLDKSEGTDPVQPRSDAGSCTESST